MHEKSGHLSEKENKTLFLRSYERNLYTELLFEVKIHSIEIYHYFRIIPLIIFGKYNFA